MMFSLTIILDMLLFCIFSILKGKLLRMHTQEIKKLGNEVLYPESPSQGGQ